MRKMLLGAALVVALTFSVGKVNVMAADTLNSVPAVSEEMPADGKSADCVWEYDSSTKTLTISSGSMMQDGFDYPWSDFEEDIRNVVIEDEVTDIGDWEFSYLTLDSVKIGTGVEEIGMKAFYSSTIKSVEFGKNSNLVIDSCAFEKVKGLKEISIPAGKCIGISAFDSCSDLSKVVIKEGMDCIERNAFVNCKSLKEVTFTGPVKEIGSCAFGKDEALEKVWMAQGVESIGESAFSECFALTDINIPSSVTTIGKYAFSECKALKEIVIPDNLLEIPHELFSNCTSLAKVTLGEHVTVIKEEAFYGCTSLENITITDSVVEIGDEAFYKSGLKSVSLGSGLNVIGGYAFAKTKLEKLAIPCNVKSIGKYALFECAALKEIAIEDGISEIGEYAFANCGSLETANIPGSVSNLSCRLFYKDESLKNITLSEGIKTGDSNVFTNCSSIEKIVLPKSLTIIPRGMFQYCTSLTSVSIGENVETISDDAFGNCDSIKSISIPGTVKNIGSYAFCGCDSLYEVDMAEGLRTIDFCAFYNSKKLKALVIPKSVTTINSRGIVYTRVNIVGYKNSAAEEYAKLRNHNFLTVNAKYNVRFDGNGATSGSTKQMSKLEVKKIYKLTKNGFKKKGYRFTGWSFNKTETWGEVIYSNREEIQALAPSDGATVTLFARWEAIPYTITYETNKGSFGKSEVENTYYIYSDAITLPTPLRNGYIFKGWYKNKDFEGNPVTVIKSGSTGSKTFYAKWELDKEKLYKITYKLDGGTNNSKNPKTFKVTTKKVTLYSPKKTGYIFEGWYKDKNCTKKITSFSGSVKKDMVVYAKWKPIQYSITFYPNGGKGKAYTVEGYKYDKKYTLKANTFKKKGYTFVGWTTTKNGTGTVYKNKAQVKNLASKDGQTVKLYAKWKKKK